jgi:hypothetical protein
VRREERGEEERGGSGRTHRARVEGAHPSRSTTTNHHGRAVVAFEKILKKSAKFLYRIPKEEEIS